MTEDINTIQKTKDKNLREAIMQEEMTRPPLPSDINARLMKRVAKEENRKRSLRLGWPWIAAACLAVVITMVLPHTRSANDTSTSEKATHAVRVLRMKEGEQILVTDGPMNIPYLLSNSSVSSFFIVLADAT